MIIERLEELGQLIYQIRDYDQDDIDYIAGRIEAVYEEIIATLGEEDE